jgi:F-type H+-transporting ATPase subunit b
VPDICFTWVNLLILFLLAKRFLFKPMKKIMDRRESDVRNMYAKAEEATAQAKRLQEEYAHQLDAAKLEVARIISEATANAETKAEAIIEQAKQKSMELVERAMVQIEKERDDSLRKAFDEVADVVLVTTSKLLERKLSMEDHAGIIDKALMEVRAGVK